MSKTGRTRHLNRVRVLIVSSLLGVIVGLPTQMASAAPVPNIDSTSPATACAGVSGGVHANQTLNRSMTIGGVTRTFRVHLPASYDGRRRLPLIVAFHGHAEKATSFEQYTQLSTLPAVVVYPDGIKGTDHALSWQGAPYSSPKADDVSFTRQILNTMRSTLCVNRARTLAVGRSNGAGFVALLSCRMPSEFAAYATVSTAVYRPSTAGCQGAAPVSVIDFHGTNDPVISYGGGIKHGTSYLSATQWIDSVVRRGHCASATVTTPLSPVVWQRTWPVCAPGVMVTHVRIDGGGHRWPGSTGNPAAGRFSDTISATRMIWDFFSLRPDRT